jgi:hypothetical protein
MALTKLIFQPGINKEMTDLMDKGGWVDANLVRFRKGLPEKIGGWEKTTTENYEGTGRALTAWVDLAATKYLGLGTTWKYYIKSGDLLDDVTPIRVQTSANEISFAATNGSSTLVITDSAHGAVANDFVTYSGCVTLGGTITATVLNQEYQVDRVTSVNTYEITAKDTSGVAVVANGSDSGNGQGTVIGKYQINVGLDVYVESTGWGAGPWSAGTFGSTTALSATIS